MSNECPEKSTTSNTFGSILAGSIGEAAASALCARYGFHIIAEQFGDNLPFDFALVYGNTGFIAARIQVKTAVRKYPKNRTLNECLAKHKRYAVSLYVPINKRNTNNKDSDSQENNKRAKSAYTELDCDYIFAVDGTDIYCLPIDLIEKSGCTTSINLSLYVINEDDPVCGNKISKLRAKDFLAEDYLRDLANKCSMMYASSVLKKAEELNRSLDTFNCTPLS